MWSTTCSAETVSIAAVWFAAVINDATALEHEGMRSVYRRSVIDLFADEQLLPDDSPELSSTPHLHEWRYTFSIQSWGMHASYLTSKYYL